MPVHYMIIKHTPICDVCGSIFGSIFLKCLYNGMYATNIMYSVTEDKFF